MNIAIGDKVFLCEGCCVSGPWTVNKIGRLGTWVLKGDNCEESFRHPTVAKTKKDVAVLGIKKTNSDIRFLQRRIKILERLTK
jgi:hypothetical protein